MDSQTALQINKVIKYLKTAYKVNQEAHKMSKQAQENYFVWEIVQSKELLDQSTMAKELKTELYNKKVRNINAAIESIEQHWLTHFRYWIQGKVIHFIYEWQRLGFHIFKWVEAPKISIDWSDIMMKKTELFPFRWVKEFYQKERYICIFPNKIKNQLRKYLRKTDKIIRWERQIILKKKIKQPKQQKYYTNIIEKAFN